MFRLPITEPSWVWKHRIAFWIVRMRAAKTQLNIAMDQAAKATQSFIQAYKDAGIDDESGIDGKA